MTDPRMGDYHDPNDPLRPSTPYEAQQSNSALGWIAGAVFLVVVLALIFGLGRDGDRTASNTGTTPPAATTGAAPPAPAPPPSPIR